MEKQIQQLEKQLNVKIDRDKSLADFTSYKIGGPAKYFFTAQNNEDLVRAVIFAKKETI